MEKMASNQTTLTVRQKIIYYPISWKYLWNVLFELTEGRGICITKRIAIMGAQSYYGNNKETSLLLRGPCQIDLCF